MLMILREEGHAVVSVKGDFWMSRFWGLVSHWLELTSPRKVITETDCNRTGAVLREDGALGTDRASTRSGMTGLLRALYFQSLDDFHNFVCLSVHDFN